MTRTHIFYLSKIALLSFVYFIAARFGLSLDAVNGFAALVWPPAGIALAVVVLYGFKYIPGVFIGAFLANLSVGAPWLTAFTIGIGNTLEAFIITYLLKCEEFLCSLNRFRDVARYIAYVISGASVGALVGTSALFLSNSILPDTYLLTFKSWWLGDILGCVVFGSLLLIWLSPNKAESKPIKARVEFLFLMVSVIFSNLIIFWNIFGIEVEDVTAFLIIYSYLLWTTLRFSQKGVVLSIFMLSIMGVLGTTLRFATAEMGVLSQNLFQLQLFIVSSSVIMMMLSALFQERKSIENRLKSLNKAKDDFLAVLAHELRNPLAPIISSIDFIKLNGVKEENSQAFETITRQAKYISRIVDDMLDISRIHRNKIILKKEMVDIREVIKHAIEAASLIIAKKNQSLHINTPSEPLWLETDQLRVNQVLVNLLNNAATYTPAKGDIWIVAMKKNNEIIVRVTDSGVGIAPDVLPNLFDHSNTIVHSLGEGYGGLGIGLKLIKYLVELHSGRIDVYSAGLGKGSEFTIYFPARRKTDKLALGRLDNNIQDKDINLETVKNNKQKVLVVDDNKDVAMSLGNLLEKLGKNVRITYSGPEAIEIVPAFNPDVILLDIGMPEMDGCEVAQKLRKNNIKSKLIAITGYGQEEDKRRCIEAGFDHHFTKPVGIKELEKVLV